MFALLGMFSHLMLLRCSSRALSPRRDFRKDRAILEKRTGPKRVVARSGNAGAAAG